MPLARKHVLLETRCKVAVVPLNHADACAHLYRQCVDIHTVIQQRERGVGVPQTVQRSVLPGAWAGNQPCICEELAERLMQVFAHRAIRQTENGQIHSLLEQIFERDVFDVF